MPEAWDDAQMLELESFLLSQERDFLNSEELGLDLRNSVRRDSRGHVWAVVDVDWFEVSTALSTYAINNGQSPAQPGHVEPFEEFTEDHLAIRTNWTSGTCAGSWDWWMWSSSSWQSVDTSAPLGPREAASVHVQNQELPLGQCSAVLLDSDWVLTAAHCVTDDNGVIQTDQFEAKLGNGQYSNSQTRLVSSIFLDGATWNNKTRTDYALLKLQQPFTAAHETMALGTQNNLIIEGGSVSYLGYPTFTGGSNCFSNLAPSEMYHQADQEVLNATTHITGRGVVQTRLDNAQRASGGPMYACYQAPKGQSPDGICNGSEAATVIGVLSGFVDNGINSKTVGAKVPGQLRNWAISTMASN